MLPLDISLRAARMLEAGRLTATLRTGAGEHVTLTLKARGKDGERWVGKPLAEALVVFVEVPNQAGWNDKVGKVTWSRGFTADSRADYVRVALAEHLLAYVGGTPLPEGIEIFEEDRCGRCGRALTDPVSVERGIGPECYGASTGSSHQVKGEDIEVPQAPAVQTQPVARVRHRLVKEIAQDWLDALKANTDASPLATELAAALHDNDRAKAIWETWSHNRRDEIAKALGIDNRKPVSDISSSYKPASTGAYGSRTARVGDWQAQKAYQKQLRADEKEVAHAADTARVQIEMNESWNRLLDAGY